MAPIARFEDIESWKKARELARLVYDFSSKGQLAQDFALRGQMRRSAISILSNIAEGYERGGDREFRQFLSLAKGSAGELRAQLYVALDAGYLSNEEFRLLYALATETARLISGFMRYLGESDLRGVKYRDFSSDASQRVRLKEDDLGTWDLGLGTSRDDP